MVRRLLAEQNINDRVDIARIELGTVKLDVTQAAPAIKPVL